MDTNITDEQLREAKAKLACHIEPPGQHRTADTEQTSAPGASCTAADASRGMGADNKVRLTQMTTAGG